MVYKQNESAPPESVGVRKHQIMTVHKKGVKGYRIFFGNCSGPMRPEASRRPLGQGSSVSALALFILFAIAAEDGDVVLHGVDGEAGDGQDDEEDDDDDGDRDVAFDHVGQWRA
ncbi:hypothetical protein N7468_007103 [Penicillium chermesinum]|uniref:Uncharacterized protein n=1 Tax=Penicillium chermesinum TaxID=63820 RepID=A0A9W9NVW2_9EURO|nr:uncharacterized protein N7468_007103 [Penicillium chermesinum]KAJ5225878.1 hypothetical protein N7468_007103 [Penicillium chermesinum]KAJ6160919.1 hypothetical protein N7470_004315 [Penicillium chermesinum]